MHCEDERLASKRSCKRRWQGGTGIQVWTDASRNAISRTATSGINVIAGEAATAQVGSSCPTVAGTALVPTCVHDPFF
eukprot:5099028-Amphidinium_carterae.1